MEQVGHATLGATPSSNSLQNKILQKDELYSSSGKSHVWSLEVRDDTKSDYTE